MKRVYILLFMIFAQYSSTFAQKQGRALADSLLVEMSGKTDTVKVKYLVNISRIYINFNYDSGIIYSADGLKLAISANWKKGIGLCNENLGLAHRLKAEYPDALNCYFNALKCYKEITWKWGIAVVYSNIATIFQYQNKYAEGIKYDMLGLAIFNEMGNKDAVAGIYADIGILQWRKNNFDSALAYSFSALRIYDSLNNVSNVARTNGNIGMIYGEVRDYDKALEFDFKSLAYYREKPDGRWPHAIRCGNIALVYLKLASDSTLYSKPGKYIPAGKTDKLKKALAYVDSAISIDGELSALYEMQEDKKIRARIEDMLGNYKAAYENYKEYIEIRDSIFSTENKVKIAKAEAKQELELKEQQIKIDKLELGKQQNEKWFLIAGILLLTIIGILFINRQRLQQKKLAAEKKNAEADLDTAKKLLDNFRLSVHEKNNIIERVTEEMTRIKAGQELQIDEESLARLGSTMLLTDEQWEEFRILFEKVHKGFFKRLKEKIPDLTPAELRFVALSKLKLSPKEMATMLGISSGSIRNYRHRLRKKLDLGEDASFEEIADAI